MTLEIAQKLVELFGDDAPVTPTTADAFNALPMMQRELIRKSIPGFVQSLLAQPESLPAAVYCRYKEGRLIHSDLPALRAAGLTLDAQALEAKNRTDEVDRMISDYESYRASNVIPEEHAAAQKREHERLRLASMNRY